MRLLVEYLSSIISPCLPCFVKLYPGPKYDSPQPLVLLVPYHPLIFTVLVSHHSPNCFPTATSSVNTFHLFARNSDPLLTNYSIAPFSSSSALFAYLSTKIWHSHESNFPPVSRSCVSSPFSPIFVPQGQDMGLASWPSGPFQTITL